MRRTGDDGFGCFYWRKAFVASWWRNDHFIVFVSTVGIAAGVDGDEFGGLFTEKGADNFEPAE